eukprot:GHUV01020849.1.p1 GENE.GHUV01020849.1~~GHUV01020849.1.p1  ORF type:complete len:193 (+),score=79.24 GHUV01020849.1:156-734(+)
MDNTFGGVWEASNLPKPPMEMRIENSIMQTVVIKGAVATAGLTGDVETTAQFPVPNAETTASAAAAPTVIVGQAIDKPANETTKLPGSAAAVASTTVGPANTASGAAPAGAVPAVPTAPSSTAAVVPPQAAGATQGGAPNPLTAAANGTGAGSAAPDGDMVTIDAQPATSAAAAAAARKPAAGARRLLLQRQ